MRGNNWVELWLTFPEVDKLSSQELLSPQKLCWNDGFEIVWRIINYKSDKNLHNSSQNMHSFDLYVVKFWSSSSWATKAGMTSHSTLWDKFFSLCFLVYFSKALRVRNWPVLFDVPQDMRRAMFWWSTLRTASQKVLFQPDVSHGRISFYLFVYFFFILSTSHHAIPTEVNNHTSETGVSRCHCFFFKRWYVHDSI